MGLLNNLFSRVKLRVIYGLGGATAPVRFSREAYEQELVRAIIDCIASHTAKATALHVVVDEMDRVKEIKRNSAYTKLLNMAPNHIMTGYDLKYKVIGQLEANTTALIYIRWNAKELLPEAMIPIPYSSFEFWPLMGGGYAVEFVDDFGETRYLNMEDVVILRKYFVNNEIAGDGNAPVYNSLSMSKAADEGLMEALSVSNKVRGLLKQKKAMLDDDDVKKSADAFTKQFMDAAKNGGIVGVDSMEDYTPLPVTPWAANAPQMREIRENIMRYWRISEPILTSNYNEDQWQAFFESIIEPRLLQMGQAFTSACFTPNERSHGNRIIFTTSTLLHTSTRTKINILQASRETGLFTVNEQREMFGYAPVEGGDKRQVSLNYVNANKQDQYQGTEGKSAEEGDEENGTLGTT